MTEREWDDPNWTTGDTLTAQQFADHVTEGHFPSDELQFTINGNGNPAFVDPQNGDAEILTYDRSAQTWTLNTLTATTEVTSPSVDATDVTSETVTATTEVTSPSVTADALEAGTITDGANVSHSDELADAADVSPIQSSSDVIVTDTQVGTLADGEFLQNSGGSLTGGTVQTEPNVPNWQEDPNSPISTSSSQNSVSFTLANDYDLVKILIQNWESQSTALTYLGLQVNGSSFNDYNYVKVDGSKVTDDTEWRLAGSLNDGFGVSGMILLDGRSTANAISGRSLIGESVDNGEGTTQLSNFSVTLPLNSLTFVTDGVFDLQARVYGWNGGA